jgi:hypothetical protein
MEIKEFVEYVFGFYGKGGLYEDFFKNKPVTKVEIRQATKLRIKTGQFEGDTFDREAVRDIMLASRGEFINFVPATKKTQEQITEEVRQNLIKGASNGL